MNYTFPHKFFGYSIKKHLNINISLFDYMMIFQLNEKLKIKAKLFRGFSDQTRLSILECLKNGEITVSKIVQEVGQSQSNVSNHLSCLLECGLVKYRREGKNKFYSFRNEKVKELLEISDFVISEVYQEIFVCTRYEKAK
jgi:DNA-binding transcriptional ArsR family regulator